MTERCDARRIQDHLDGELSAAETLAFREHLAGCPRCAAELALYRRTFAALDAIALAHPPASLADRVLERVLPSRVRRRWVRTFGWAYAGVFAASLVAVTVWTSQPGTRSLLAGVADVLSKRVIESLMFVLNALAFLMVSLVNGWGLLTAASARLAPFARALAAVLSDPGIQITLVTAGAACGALLWWIRPREKRKTEGVRHVGVLGF
jgi:anti-sigma factor RsiW